LVGVVSLRELFSSPPEKQVRDVMRTDLVTCSEQTDQEALSRLFAHHDLIAIPVVDPDGRMKGVVTVDDIVDVVQEVATEDAQKFGGMEALEEPYMATPLRKLLRKRGGWLSALLIGEMLTTSAMAYYEEALARMVVLATFVPLIISSGGNSGSQASTLVIRAMALGEVRLRDWFRVVQRELVSGFGLGVLLAVLGFLRILAWQALFNDYGEQSVGIGLTVGASLLGVVMFGTMAGALLPFLLRRLGADPASASAPFVATLVDVTGVIIFFSAASVFL
jgi:magnesium transporter